MNIIGCIDSVGRDLRRSLRGLLRHPAFALAAIPTLGLGIGATASIFSVVYSVLIKPLPYPDSDELVRIRHNGTAGDMPAASTMYRTYRDNNQTFSDIGIWQESDATLTDGGDPSRVRALRVADGTLQAFEVQPLHGRWFSGEEHGPAVEGPAPVILSHAYWQRRFGGDEAAIGRELSVESQPARVVGIMPPGFRFLDMTPQPDVILAVRLDPAAAFDGFFNYQMLARLEPGVTPAEARADLERMLPIWSPEAALAWQIRPGVRPLKEDLVGGVRSALWVLMGAIGAVLLIACANIANLMLVRADAQRQEFAMRAALGAVPARIAREVLIESLVISAAGGVLGLMLAWLGLQVLAAIAPTDLPRLHEIAIHPPVLAFTAAVSLASTLVFGSVAAFRHVLRIDTPVIGAARGATASRERNATRSALVVAQVALALVLVVSAALMIRTFQALRDVDSGFSDPATIQTARIWIPTGPSVDPADSRQWTRLEHEILDRIEALPGVDSAGFVSDLPIAWPGIYADGLAVQGRATAAGDEPPQGLFKFVSPGYFEAMGTRMIAGREMTWSDIETGGRVVVISEGLARELAPEPAAALGMRVRLASVEDDDWREVIGVVQRIHEGGLYAEAPGMVYWPVFMEDMGGLPEMGTPTVTFAVRSERAGTAGLMQEIRQAVRLVSASIPIAQERTMQDLYAGSLARTSFTLVMLAIAGGMALVLGIIGIYGVIAYVVTQRAREIGIRSALGAEPRQLERMFLRRGLALGAVGAALGLVAAAALGRLMSSLLFGIGPMDARAFMAALVIVIAAVALASYLPARRAAMVSPMETLRAE